MPANETPSSPQLNATVMASAGTGKTFLLVSRLLRLLLAGARPDAVLAITFTRKAAAEMHSRLAERLLQLAAATDHELAARLRELEVTPDTATMARARHLYETMLQQRQTVRTTTFHAFCQEILLRFPLEADVPPGFELLDNDGELRQSAWQAMLAEASAAADGELAEALQHLLDYCGGLHGLTAALFAFLDHRGDWWAYTEASTQPRAFAERQLHENLQLKDLGDPLEQFFTPRRNAALGEFAELLRSHPIKTNLDALEQLSLARSEALSAGERFRACQGAFLTQKGEPRARKSSKAQAGKMGIDGEMRLLAIHHETCAALLETRDRLMAQQCWQANRAWYLAGQTLLEHYQRLKREQRLLDFTDLEWQACQLLNRSAHANWVQYKLDQRIEHLLVDEFQDTNPTQWRLLLPLLQEMAAGEAAQPRSVFLVGDAKQSIYRFRRAEPRLFQVAHQWLEEHLAARAFPLHTSWRSAPAIMQCVNQVFGEDGPMRGLLRDFNSHQTHHLELPGRVTVLPLVRLAEADSAEAAAEQPAWALRDPLRQPRQLPSDDRYLREGRQIAMTIRQLIEAGEAVGHGEAARAIGYGDIMLLVRKRSHVGDYEQALRELGIPYVGAERGTLLESIEVSDMVALLEWLITPFNNVALATVLRCPLFACTDSDLLALAREGKGNWYPRLLLLGKEITASSALQRAATLLPQWRAIAGSLPIHDLLDRIYQQANVLQCYRHAVAPHLQGRVEANLTRFIELALDIDSGRYPSLGHFLARLEALRQGQGDAPDEAPASSDSERVRIMTIHASKGLEAPVVFLADTTNSESADKAWRCLIDWPPESERPQAFALIGRQDQQPAFFREQITREQQEAQRELANLCYVALTRPRQQLYISGTESRRSIDGSWYQLLRQAIDPLGNHGLDEACSLSNGLSPRGVPIPPASPALFPLPFDPALTRPLPEMQLSRELAPSHAGTQAMRASHSETDEDGRLRGLVIHRLLQRLTEHPPSSYPLLRQQVAAEFGLDPDSADYAEWYRESEDLLETMALEAVFKPAAGVEFFNEVPIIYAQHGQTVHGIIDRLRLDADELWLIDFKTHRASSPATLQALAERYRQQMQYYATGLRRLWPEHRLRCLFLFTHTATLHELNGVETT